MFKHSLTAKRILLNGCLSTMVALMFSTNVSVVAQQTDYESEKRRAAELLDESKTLQALPIFEKLAAQNPKDRDVQFYLGFCLLAKAADTKDPAARKQERARARVYLVRAKELGMSDALLDQMLASIPPDGGETPKFSSNPEAEAAMNDGESAYAHGDLDKALGAYSRALQLDPKLYHAALFAGDMQFKRGHNSTDAAERSALFDKAGEWFSKAIAIDPDRETAYRYWGDALLEYGKDNEARAKFIEAIVADPYNQLVYSGLTKWGRKNQVSLGHPRIDIPSNVGSNKPGEVNITVDELALKGSDNDGSAAWIMYGMSRSLWVNKKDGTRSDKFAKAYPNESVYRHSLTEELEALQGVVESVRDQTKEKRVKKLTPSLENLTKLNDAGLLEAYIFFVKPDKGIARDYPTYRKANREKLERYWLDIVIGAK
jgi:tetratricopeptide (TPR) repeat protein